MADLKLLLASFHFGQWAAVRDGRVKPDGIEIEVSDVPPRPVIYRRMVRDLDFDIAEVAVTTYVAAKWFKIPITAIPVMGNRDLSMSAIQYNVRSGIKAPKDLEGKRVGVLSYTVTNTTQCRALLNYELGVDTDKIQWVVADDAHVAQYKEPPNVEYAPEGKTLEDMLLAGEIDAGMGLLGPAEGDIKLLLSEDERNEIGLQRYKRTGLLSIGHIMTIKDDVLKENPWVAPAMFQAFKASKDLYLNSLSSITDPAPRDRQALRNREIIGGDPLPFGLERNRKDLEAMIQMDVDQHIIPELMDVDSLFAPNTLDLD